MLCRQKAYRKRSPSPHTAPLQLLRSDLFAIKDREARKRAAVAALNRLGYEVQLKWVGGNVRQASRGKPRLLQAVDRDAPGDD